MDILEKESHAQINYTIKSNWKIFIFYKATNSAILLQKIQFDGIHRDIRSRGSRHDDGGVGGSRDSRRGDSHHHHIRGCLQEQWLPPFYSFSASFG